MHKYLLKYNNKILKLNFSQNKKKNRNLAKNVKFRTILEEEEDSKKKSQVGIRK